MLVFRKKLPMWMAPYPLSKYEYTNIVQPPPQPVYFFAIRERRKRGKILKLLWGRGWCSVLKWLNAR